MIMKLPIPDKVEKLWDLWNLRFCILLSLSVQAFLVLFASSRQRCKSSFLLFLIWGAYLLADWIAPVAIGLTTKSQGDDKSCDRNTTGKFNQEISAFWASFLLLHLGGPDSITSFSLEDNELWMRHLFGLILQALAAAYSFYLSLPRNKLWPPTVLVFLVGIVKYVERTSALYLASLDHFGAAALPKPDPGPDYEKTSTIYDSRLLRNARHAKMMTRAPNSTSGSYDDQYFDPEIVNSEDLDEMELLQIAYELFEKFKGLIVGFFFTTYDRDLSRELFVGITDHKPAFRLIEYELSFLFQILHTKVVVMRSRFGYLLHGFSFSSLLGASIYFSLVEKKGLGTSEIILTHALLIGAIFLDAVSIIKLFFSDWTLAILKKNNWILKYVPGFILKRSKWSRLVSQYNMMDYCLDERPKRLYKFAGRIHVPGILDKIKIMWFSSSEKVTEDLKKFIFDDLKRKSMNASSLRDAVQASLERGYSALLEWPVATKIKLEWSIREFEYTESLLLWHIATEICYLEENPGGDQKKTPKRKCKLLSDYMFYLLIMQPNMLSTILGQWYIVFQDTCAEAKVFFSEHSVFNRSEAFREISSTKTKFRPAAVKGTKSKSVFFDACILAQQLQGLGDNQWGIMDRMWVELTCYAAINCKPTIHAQQPGRGGELLTFTWLLMNHFGLGIQFSDQKEQVGTKMKVVK